jgi:hypothetical protein
MIELLSFAGPARLGVRRREVDTSVLEGEMQG